MNHLKNETSPYLLQHADNPVDWHPWNEEALEAARKSGKPILLSIGYSACHWCHVMAHESFEDAETAELMNRLFINIKVDREERPDLDKIYQTAHHIMNQRGGGWPLTVFLRPDNHMPFFTGTYFPKEPRSGLISFREVLQRVSDWYAGHPKELDDISTQLTDILHSMEASTGSGSMPDESVISNAINALSQSFDSRYGGFGRAPKFPHPGNLERLMRYHYRHPDHDRSQHMYALTLQQMALGGIYDQLGGGFCRYSVDDYWMIPHFEKMLYDNGPLLAIYAEAHAATGNPLFRRIAVETAGWTIREMQSPQGGYYASLDADSEGEEGKYYVWQPEEVEAVLDETNYNIFCQRFGLDGTANFEGRYNLHVTQSLEDLASEYKRDMDDITRIIDESRATLLTVRERRVRPGRDDKILTSWNALMVRGMCVAARYLQEDIFLDSARHALDFILNRLWVDGRLLATHKDGKSRLMAYLDDHAFLIDAILEYLQVHWHTPYLQFACALADNLLEHYEDREGGGFYFTADDHEQLIQRPRPFFDDAIPSGNGVAATALQRLGHLVGDTRYTASSENTLKASSTLMREQSVACNSLLTALEEYLNPPDMIIIRGPETEMAHWRSALGNRYAPDRLVFCIPANATNLPPALAEKTASNTTTTAWRCTGTACAPPVTDLDTLVRQPGSDK